VVAANISAREIVVLEGAGQPDASDRVDIRMTVADGDVVPARISIETALSSRVHRHPQSGIVRANARIEEVTKSASTASPDRRLRPGRKRCSSFAIRRSRRSAARRSLFARCVAAQGRIVKRA